MPYYKPFEWAFIFFKIINRSYNCVVNGPNVNLPDQLICSGLRHLSIKVGDHSNLVNLKNDLRPVVCAQT